MEINGLPRKLLVLVSVFDFVVRASLHKHVSDIMLDPYIMFDPSRQLHATRSRHNQN